MSRNATTAVPQERDVRRAELMVLPDGQILAHNLTPELAAVLAELNPQDDAMRVRAEGITMKSKSKIRIMSTNSDRTDEPASEGPEHAAETA